MNNEILNKSLEFLAADFTNGSNYGCRYDNVTCVEDNVHVLLKDKISDDDYREFDEVYCSAITSIAEFSYEQGIKDGVKMIMSFMVN